MRITAGVSRNHHPGSRFSQSFRVLCSPTSAVNAQLSRAQGDKIHLQLVRGHLLAAGVIVSPMDPAVQGRLDVLSARLDQAILNDFKINAAFDLIKVVLSAAEEISDISSSHT